MATTLPESDSARRQRALLDAGRTPARRLGTRLRLRRLTKILRRPERWLTRLLGVDGTIVAMSSSTKLTAMRAWVAALKAYDEAWTPFADRSAQPPGPDEANRLAELSAQVQQSYERYHRLGWTDANGAA